MNTPLKANLLPLQVLNCLEDELKVKVMPDCISYKAEIYEKPCRDNDFYPYSRTYKVAECAEAQFLVLYKDFYVRRYKIEVTSCIDVSPDLEEHSITEFKATVIAVLEKA